MYNWYIPKKFGWARILAILYLARKNIQNMIISHIRKTFGRNLSKQNGKIQTMWRNLGLVMSTTGMILRTFWKPCGKNIETKKTMIWLSPFWTKQLKYIITINRFSFRRWFIYVRNILKYILIFSCQIWLVECGNSSFPAHLENFLVGRVVGW